MNALKVLKKEEYTIVQMNRGKVNAINYDMVQELRQVFRDIENDSTVKGAILTGQPHYFSAGLDLIELFQYDKKKVEDFFFGNEILIFMKEAKLERRMALNAPYLVL